MAHPPTEQHIEQVVAPVADQGLVDAAWSLMSSGFVALAGWIVTHWADVGLGLVAVIFTMLATQATKSVLDLIRKRISGGIEDDMYSFLVRGMLLCWGVLWAGLLDFPKHFGDAIGVDLQIYEGWSLFAGGLSNQIIALGLWHSGHWLLFSEGDMATFLRQTFRVKIRKKVEDVSGVTDEERAEVATEKQSPAQMAELRKALAEEKEDEQ